MSDAKRLAALKAVWKELESFHTECDSVLFPDGVPDDDDIDKLFQKTLQGTLTKSDAQKLYLVPPVDIRRLDDSLDASELLKAVDDLEQCYPGGELPEEVRGDADKLRALFRHPIQRRQVWQALRLTRPKWFPWIADEANRLQGIDLPRDKLKMGVVPELILKGEPGEPSPTVDVLFLGRGKQLSIWKTDYAVIDGEQPIVCPFAEPKLHQGVLERLAHNLRTGGIGFKAVNEAQQTICWLGHQSKTETLCECYVLKRPYRECPLKRKEKLGDESEVLVPSPAEFQRLREFAHGLSGDEAKVVALLLARLDDAAKSDGLPLRASEADVTPLIHLQGEWKFNTSGEWKGLQTRLSKKLKAASIKWRVSSKGGAHLCRVEPSIKQE